MNRPWLITLVCAALTYLAGCVINPDWADETLVAAYVGLILGIVVASATWYFDRRLLLREIERANADHWILASYVAEWEDDHTNPLTREMVKLILENATNFKWTIQGFGLLRLYLGRHGRLHIWDPRYKMLNASEIHDHYWPLKSRVIAGRLTNHRYSVAENPSTPTHLCHVIRTGEGGGPATEPVEVALIEVSAFEYGPGEAYSQNPTEVHRSDPEPGTVTLMARPEGDPGSIKTARSFWPIGEEWGTAEPRPATEEEVRDITQAALRRWF